MIASLILALGIGLALGSQLHLLSHFRRRWVSVPKRIPYGTLNGRPFAWGPREVIWIVPSTLIALTIALGIVIAVSPLLLLNVSLLMIPFLVLAVATPFIRNAIDKLIDVAQQRAS